MGRRLAVGWVEAFLFASKPIKRGASLVKTAGIFQKKVSQRPSASSLGRKSIPSVDYVQPPGRAARGNSARVIHMKTMTCFIFFILLTVLSLYVFLKNGVDEPYLSFEKDDAILQIGIASVALLLWIQFYFLIAFNKKTLHLVCLFFIPIGILFSLILLICINGYIHDIQISSKKMEKRLEYCQIK